MSRTGTAADRYATSEFLRIGATPGRTVLDAIASRRVPTSLASLGYLTLAVAVTVGFGRPSNGVAFALHLLALLAGVRAAVLSTRAARRTLRRACAAVRALANRIGSLLGDARERAHAGRQPADTEYPPLTSGVEDLTRPSRRPARTPPPRRAR